MAASNPRVPRVFVTSSSGHSGGGPKIIHTRRDCESLARAKRILEKPINVYPEPHRAWCRTCGPHGGTE